MDFFRKGFKALEAIDPVIRLVAEKHRIDYQLSALDSGNAGESEAINSYERLDDGELSFDYRPKKQGVDNVSTSSYLMEVDRPDVPHLQVPTLEDREIINQYKHQGEQFISRQKSQNRVSSYSAPLFPDKVDSSEKPKETQPQRKYYSYVLPSPIDTKSPISKTPTSVSPTPNNPFSKNERDFGNDASTSKARSTIKDGNSMDSSTQLPTPRDGHSGFDSKLAKRQAYSGPLQPTKTFSGKIASTSGPISSTELPQIRSNVTRSVSPPPLSSPKISELHELPRPPPKPAVLVSSGSGTGGYLSSLSFKNPEISVSNKSPTASPLPPPPLAVSRSFSLHSSNNPSGRGGRVEEVSSPPLTPILLSSMKTTSRT
ncbi:arfaptin homology domain/BAR domain protein [Tanacetum coccineum]